jgi:hypothetical protein
MESDGWEDGRMGMHANMPIYPSTSAQAEDDARAALEYDPCFVKAYVRAAKVYIYIYDLYI